MLKRICRTRLYSTSFSIHGRKLILSLAVNCLLVPFAAEGSGRKTVSLNGTWQIEDSISATEMPKEFGHTVVVPGFVNLSKPSFPDVDMFASREYFQKSRKLGNGDRYPWGGPVVTNANPLPVIGISMQERNYFWYKRSFEVNTTREVAILEVNKSQFGTKVWLNGTAIGEHLSCWTAGYFDMTKAIDWEGKNELVIRIGAHPAVLPVDIIGAGTQRSKMRWTPGIYDSVNLILCDNPVIKTIQVAPRIKTSEVTIQTTIKNYDATVQDVELSHRISTWKVGNEVAKPGVQRYQLKAGEEKTVTQNVAIPNARLWSPDDPFLYSVESNTQGDSVRTRFGMREVRFDGKTKKAYLNGREFYMRGGNIELSLHFEDPKCGTSVWDEAWVRKVLIDVPKKLNWNTHRICLTPVPTMWLDMADEEGILLQYEPNIWKSHKEWDTDKMIQEFARWMRDNWNHPSVFMWDTNNETRDNRFVDVINAVRKLDLSGRQWDNGWSPRAHLDDPGEAHPYVVAMRKDRDLRAFGRPVKMVASASEDGALIINEYAWLWLHGDGADTGGHSRYEKMMMLPKTATNMERLEFRWYMSAAVTEYWRTQRRTTGVLYYEYVGSTLRRQSPGPRHFGAFSDVDTLELQPYFETYMGNAYKPLGVCIEFWGDEVPDRPFNMRVPMHGGNDRTIKVTTINDDTEPVKGGLILSLLNSDGDTLASAKSTLTMDAVGRQVHELTLPIPAKPGNYSLKAVASPEGTRHKGPTESWRKIEVLSK